MEEFKPSTERRHVIKSARLRWIDAFLFLEEYFWVSQSLTRILFVASISFQIALATRKRRVPCGFCPPSETFNSCHLSLHQQNLFDFSNLRLQLPNFWHFHFQMLQEVRLHRSRDNMREFPKQNSGLQKRCKRH